MAIGGALLAGAAAAGTAIWTLRPSSNAPARAPAQFSLTLPDNEQVGGLDFPAIAISPLDTHIVYVANRGGRSQLFLRPMDSPAAQPLAGTEGALGPFFSPDGQWIAFFAAGSLKKVPVAGGAIRTIAEAAIGFGGAWAPDNTIVFAPSNASELWRVPADGGKPQPITALDPGRGEFSHRWPEILPDGKSVLFAVGTEGGWDDAVIAVQTIGANDRRTVVQGGTSPRLSSSGHLLYTRGGVLYSRPFDGRREESGGQPVPKVARIVESSDGAGQFSISRAGTLAYVPASSGQSDRTLVWVGRDGSQQPLAAPPHAFSDPRLSPDGRMIAMTIVGPRSDVWTYEIAGNRLAQFTFDGGTSPIWSADGQRIVFAANRGGSRDLFSKPIDGNRVEERLMRTPHADVRGPGVRTEGSSSRNRARTVVTLPRSCQIAQCVRCSPRRQTRGRRPSRPMGAYSHLSPTSRASRRCTLLLLTDPRRVTRVSSAGGSEPVWRKDGTELYFRSGTQMLVASVRTQPSIAVQAAQPLFSGRFETGAAWRPAYDVSRDGTQFLMVRAAERQEPGRELRIFLGWKPE